MTTEGGHRGLPRDGDVGCSHRCPALRPEAVLPRWRGRPLLRPARVTWAGRPVPSRPVTPPFPAGPAPRREVGARGRAGAAEPWLLPQQPRCSARSSSPCAAWRPQGRRQVGAGRGCGKGRRDRERLRSVSSSAGAAAPGSPRARLGRASAHTTAGM